MRKLTPIELLVIAVTLAVVVALAMGARDCSRRKGQYVRTVFWFTCILPEAHRA